MTNEEFDDFLNDATHAVADLWEQASGQTLTNLDSELYDLNDTLEAFFASKRPTAKKSKLYLEAFLPPGKTKIWYSKPEAFRDMSSGKLPSVATLHETHVLLGTTNITDKEEIFSRLQGESWSPKGEAKELISYLGLKHTSMCMGDVVEIDGIYYVVGFTGFKIFQ